MKLTRRKSSTHTALNKMNSPRNKDRRSSRGYLKAANSEPTAAAGFSPMILPRGTDITNFVMSPKDDTKYVSSDDNASIQAFAGSSFESPPAADCLPRPPTHWIDRAGTACYKLQYTPQESKYSQDLLTRHLKALLKVPAQA